MTLRDENDRETAVRRRFRAAPQLLAALLFLLLLGGWYVVADRLVHWATDRDVDGFVIRSRESADQIASNLARNLLDEVRRLSNLPEILVGDPILQAPLLADQPGKRAAKAIEDANERLHSLAEQLEVDIVYELDATGHCIAASNFDTDISSIGADLHARQYFTAIENGGRGRQFAFGSANGVPGVYFSSPITRDGKFLGGIVVKRSMRSLFHVTTRNAAFLVDEYGVVVASTLEQALWHTMPDAAATRLGADFLQDRYRHATLSPIEIHADSTSSTVSLITLFDNPQPSLMTARPVGDSSLRLVFFTPLPDLATLQERSHVFFWLVYVSGALVLTLVLGAVVAILQTRGQVAAVRHGYRKLAALSRELAAQKEAAEAADRAKTEFLATMSHELRTPFSGILGVIDLLVACELPDEAAEKVGLLDRSARALLGRLNDMLDFSRIESGQLRVEKQPFDLFKLMAEIAEIQQVVAQAKGITLSIESVGGRTIGLGDADRLRQVIDNYIANAIKFTALGGVKVTVQLSGRGAERSLRITVKDSGPGLTPEARRTLFQPFFQGDLTVSRRYGGSGLGLAISKRVAEAMGGNVGVDSEAGEGASFWVQVPFPETSLLPRQPDARRPSDAFAAIATPGIGRRILMADDDEANRLVIGGMLRRAGHHVTYALDGRAAVKEIHQQDFDLVLMDMHMPDMDGITATRAVRSMSGAKATTPIIGLTADGVIANRQIYLAAGLNDLLTKPITASALQDAIKHHAKVASL